MVIFFVAQDGAGAVKLLGEDESHQLMRKGELGEGPAMVGTREDPGVETVNAADKEHEVLTAAVSARLYELGKVLGGELLPALVKRYEKIIFCEKTEDGVGLLFFEIGGREGGSILLGWDDGPFGGEIAG